MLCGSACDSSNSEGFGSTIKVRGLDLCRLRALRYCAGTRFVSAAHKKCLASANIGWGLDWCRLCAPKYTDLQKETVRGPALRRPLQLCKLSSSRFENQPLFVRFVNLFADITQPLPSGWECITMNNRTVFLNHANKETSFYDPRIRRFETKTSRRGRSVPSRSSTAHKGKIDHALISKCEDLRKIAQDNFPQIAGEFFCVQFGSVRHLMSFRRDPRNVGRSLKSQSARHLLDSSENTRGVGRTVFFKVKCPTLSGFSAGSATYFFLTKINIFQNE